MSVITTKSTVLSILRTPNTVRTSLNKVRFQLPNDIKRIFIDFKKGCNSRDYEDLVCTIRDSEISDKDLLTLLKEAKNCISVLSYDLRLFVQALIIIRWTHRSEEVINCYQEFINDLVSAHCQHTKTVIDQLIKLFLLDDECEWIDGEPSEIQLKQFQAIHFILKSVIETIPMCEDIVVESIRHHYPYHKTLSFKQESYIFNMLKIIEYQPTLRLTMLQFIVDKLISIDVHAPRDEIIKAEEEEEESMFKMDVDEDNENLKQKGKVLKHPLGQILDSCMEQVFRFFKKECFKNGELVLTKTRLLFNEVLYVFENVLVKTHASHHVQFLIFYLCSFDKSLPPEFLRCLWRKVTAVEMPPVMRHAYVAYLASFLSRADYLPLGYLKTYLTKMCEWVHLYIANNDGVSQLQRSTKHHVFYSVCEAVFYLIAFRHKDLVDSRRKLVFLQSLNLSKMVTCKLNPLRFCLPAVQDNFASMTRVYQLCYCFTVIEHNARDLGAMKRRLQMYFPFDPYVLAKTSGYITPLYREYQSLVSEEVASTSKRRKRRTRGSDNEEEDDFLEQSLNSSLTGGAGHCYDFSYSSSPGFKQSV